MRKQLFIYLLGLTGALFISSCASLTGFEEGRTIGSGNNEIIASVNFTTIPNIFDRDSIGRLDSEETLLTFPNIEFAYKNGVSNKAEVGVKVSITSAVVSGYFKYQLVGDSLSSFAIATGVNVTTIFTVVYNIGVPIYASYYPTDNITINLSPRYEYQFFPLSDNATAIQYLGGNFGVLFGKKNKFGLDIGYYNVVTDGRVPAFLTYGIGGKFRF